MDAQIYFGWQKLAEWLCLHGRPSHLRIDRPVNQLYRCPFESRIFLVLGDGANLTHCIPYNHPSHSLLYCRDVESTREDKLKSRTFFSSKNIRKNCKPIYSGKIVYSRHDTMPSLPHIHSRNFSTQSHWPLLLYTPAHNTHNNNNRKCWLVYYRECVRRDTRKIVGNDDNDDDDCMCNHAKPNYIHSIARSRMLAGCGTTRLTDTNSIQRPHRIIFPNYSLINIKTIKKNRRQRFSHFASIHALFV